MAKAKGKGNLYGSTNPDFVPTVGQIAQARMLGSSATHCMAYGGAGSSKTFGWIACMLLRSFAVPHRALIVRRHFKHARQFIGQGTIPEVRKTVFPGIPIEVNKSDWVFTFPNGSELWLGGMDDGTRREKILGAEFGTIYVNETSEFHDFDTIALLRTRLRQKTPPMPPKMLYDCNPPTKSHWSHQEFIEGIVPGTLEEKVNGYRKRYACILMNPDQNWQNLSDAYKSELEALPEAQRRRFLHGLWSEDSEFALWKIATIDRYRINPDDVPPLVYIVVACDPAATAEEGSDETGIVVAGKDDRGHLYILEDASFKGHPAEWGARLLELYRQYSANVIVAERNMGGSMVEHVIRTTPGGGMVPYESIWSSRGKVVRAEPVAGMYEQGMIHHAGTFRYLEDEQTRFEPINNDPSPNRMDAAVFACVKLAGLDPGAFTMGKLMQSAAGDYEA